MFAQTARTSFMKCTPLLLPMNSLCCGARRVNDPVSKWLPAGESDMAIYTYIHMQLETREIRRKSVLNVVRGNKRAMPQKVGPGLCRPDKKYSMNACKQMPSVTSIQSFFFKIMPDIRESSKGSRQRISLACLPCRAKRRRCDGNG